MDELIIGMIILVVLAMIAAAFIANDASKRGMNAAGWSLGVFLALVIFLPLYLIVRKPLLPQVVEGEQLAAADVRKCPFCAEIIKIEALVCRFCGRDLPQWLIDHDRPEAIQKGSEVQVKCGICDYLNPSDARLCINCGKMFTPRDGSRSEEPRVAAGVAK